MAYLILIMISVLCSIKNYQTLRMFLIKEGSNQLLLYAKFSGNSGYCQFWPLSIVQRCQDERQGGTEIQFRRTIALDPILLRGLPQKYIYLMTSAKKLFPAKGLLPSNQPLMLMHPLSNTRFLPQSQYIYSISGYISIHFNISSIHLNT